jgi:SSS family solute:Na+ symporter
LGITALLAGFMAGQAGNVSAFNTVFTYDIYRAVIKKDASDAQLLWVGRVTTIVGILLSVATAYLAMQFNAIMDYIQAIFSWVNAPLFATMLLGMFWKRTTSHGAFYGLLVGMAVSFSIFLGFKLGLFSPATAHLITFADNPSDMTRNLWQAIWAWLVCFGVTVAISLVTTPKTDAELQGLVKGLTPDIDDSQVVWYGKPAFWAAVAFVVLVALNVVFR